MGLNHTQVKAVTIAIIQEHPTIYFAIQELTNYLLRMSPEHHIDFRKEAIYSESEAPYLWVGSFGEFGISMTELEDPELDDAIYINVMGGKGHIAGSNPRSVLLGVYRFLEEAGCRFLRPGADGDYVPKKALESISVKVNEKAAYRHRGLCIEGAVSIENMLDNIHWAPKAGFNSYFLEFKTPYTFFDRWYGHRHNKYKQPETITVEQVDAFTVEMEKEIKKRGLIYHAVGHGWTGEPLGLPCLGWDSVDYAVDEEKSRYFALVDGKRELWHGVPLNTNLCFSNPEARKLVVQYAADHAQKNPHIDMLHFWLADAFNNHCECEDCVKALPSDFYMMMLNELDEELTSRNLSTKVVFLLYLDLLWVPETETLKNPGRFMLLFAPISRTYSSSYDSDTTGIEIQPFVRNRLKFPTNIRENVAFLKAWQELFDGDGFTYEYHHMWDHYLDPGYFQMADMISQDVKNLKILRLNGIVSDQTQRSFFPTGLGMYVLGKTLWNDEAEFTQLAKEYFMASFGDEGEACLTYLKTISDLFDPPYMRGEKPRVSIEAAEKLRSVQEIVNEFRPVMDRNLAAGLHPTLTKSWEYLQFHADIVSLLASALAARAEGRAEDARQLWSQTSDYVERNEDLYQPVFDVFLYIQTLHKMFDDHTKTHFGGEVT
ncbi:DUF4838 domain-containing protein [Paenibacillus sp. Soil724D2]|uniref:DUF4838 domain-containing protein n=1 Tax=Paenibacillus sp. (strain Soil724D2) TaxID=1736392 RepID=UPI000715B495|nr:DUF4838 domain-containing protein [Paenibacillus sp. Soil724D2]KRE36486.1 hypothetical protein ASG85_09980 [Paenibacillus sp. Soil724D2]